MKKFQILKIAFSVALLNIPIFSIAATPSIAHLNYRIVDAEYSKSLNRIVSVSANPSRLHSYDPISNIDTPINLPMSPSSVSVSPDGLFAAVGHNGKISYIDLQNKKLVKIMSVSTDVLDLVLAGNSFVYAFPRADQWVGIHSVNIKNSKELPVNNWGIYAGTVAKLHPNGKAMYGANNGISPSGIEKYTIGTDGAASVLYDSPYHGDYAICGNLWISEDGLRIFTACGNVFRSSTVKSEDMIYNGKLSDANGVIFAAHSIKAKKVAVISGNSLNSDNATSDTSLQIYNYNYLTLSSKISLPNFRVNTTNYAAHGRFVFYNSDSSKLFVIAQADSSSGMLYDYGVVSYDTGLSPCDISAGASDCDSDSIPNKNDNCILVPNKPRPGSLLQLDSDGDHYGNFCDTDLNNDKLVNGTDLSLWLGNTRQTSSWLSICGSALYDEKSDFNGDCKVDILDSNIITNNFFKKPGPSCIDLPATQRGSQC